MSIETITDRELIAELAKRHDQLIVIRPNLKNDDKLEVFTQTSCDVGGYDLVGASQMLQDAQIAIIEDNMALWEKE